jgi:hypothetical protein
MVHRRLICLIPICLLALTRAAASIAANDNFAFKIIVRSDNAITTVDRGFLRDVYLKKTIEWHDGSTIRPVDLAQSFPARERFTQDVLKKTSSQLKNYWNQQIFSGKNVPPPEASSAADMISYVLETPGAVGYLPAGVDAGGAKVIEVR